MELKQKMSYEAPIVEIIEVEVEKGFATSGFEGNGNNSSGNMDPSTGSF